MSVVDRKARENAEKRRLAAMGLREKLYRRALEIDERMNNGSWRGEFVSSVLLAVEFFLSDACSPTNTDPDDIPYLSYRVMAAERILDAVEKEMVRV